MNKPMTATEVLKRREEAGNCACGRCELCYVKGRIDARQKAIFGPLIKKLKGMLGHE